MADLNIVITDGEALGSDISFERFKRFGNVEFYPLTAPDEVAERVKDADIIICSKTPINPNTLGKAERLKLVDLFATGYNNVDLDMASARGIKVCNVPAYSTEAVAQHVFALILEHYSRVGEYAELVANGDWIKTRMFSYFPLPTNEISGKTIGIVGFGSIGKRVAAIASAFGMKILCYTRTPRTAEGVEFVSLDELLSRSDIVTLHCPLNSGSEKMMNAETFGKMNQGAFFVNTSRGGTVDEFALAEALKSGKLSGAGLDVLNSEPMSKDCPLIGIKNCLITPHIAWVPEETRRRLADKIYENIEAFLDGKPINVVND